MRYSNIVSIFGFIFLLIITGCDLVNSDNERDEEIQAFIKSQPLSDTQDPVIILGESNQDFKVFRVSFGPPRDCPSGCFYTQGFGIKFGNRIGWTAVDTDSSQYNSLNFFDVRPDDDYLFSQDVINRFQEVVRNLEDGSWNPHAYKSYLRMLARDTDTPTASLLNIAELLYSEYHPGVAATLIENQVVRNNKLILETLAELPSFNRSEFYKQVRDQARILLDQTEE